MGNLTFFFTAVLSATLTMGLTTQNAQALTRVDVVRLGQVHTAVELMASVDPSPFPEYTFVWTPSYFGTRYHAQLMLDILRLSTAWNGWINQDGQFIRGFRSKTRLVISNEPFEPLADVMRATNILEWLKEQVLKNPSLAAHASDFLRLMPRDMAFAKESVQHALASARVSPEQLAGLHRDIDRLIDQALKPGPQRRCETLFFPAKRAFRVI